jgi:hypothetical protein
LCFLAFLGKKFTTSYKKTTDQPRLFLFCWGSPLVDPIRSYLGGQLGYRQVEGQPLAANNCVNQTRIGVPPPQLHRNSVKGQKWSSRCLAVA